MEYVLTIASTPFERGRSIMRRLFWHLHDHVVPHERNGYHPHMLRGRTLTLLSLLLITVKVSVATLGIYGPATLAESSAITPETIFTLTNQSRAGSGAAALTYNTVLEQAAQAKAEALLACQCFQHTLPDGRTPWEFFKAAGYQYLMAGENLAVDFTDAEAVDQAWMNSPGHKANIVNKNFEELGVGVARGTFQGHQAIFVVQMFGTPAEQPIAVQHEPTPVKEVSSVPKPRPAEPAGTVKNEWSEVPKAEDTASAVAKIVDVKTSLSQGLLYMTVFTSEQTSEVLARFGEKAVRLAPRSDTLWEGTIPLDHLVDSPTVTIHAENIAGATDERQVATFTRDAARTFNWLGTTAQKSIRVGGMNIDLHQTEHQFYLLFIAGILTCLVIAVGVKRHVQHVQLIANTSFVAVLATLMWLV